jgi:hypothetical protein
MTQNISGFGVVVNLVASTTFPVGITITQFADDSDPVDFGSVKIADTAMGLNGDLLRWARAVALPVVLNVVPGSDDDVNLGILADANRVGQGKVSAYDSITLTVVYPDGTTTTYTGGIITDAMFSKSISSAGRLKTKPYAFSFETKIGA